MIRPGRDDDAPGFMALIAACWGEYPGVVCNFDAELPEIRALDSHMAERGGALWAAAADGAIVGMVAAAPKDDGWHLSRMYVAAGHRGTGLAAQLMQCAEAHARAAGAVQMVLWTDILFTRAHAFYERQGYIRRGDLRSLQDLSNSIEARYWKPLTGRPAEDLDVAAAESAERVLAALLQQCAATGVATPFLPPVSDEAARAYWRGVTQAVGRGERRLLRAWREGVVAGSIQVEWNGPEATRHCAALQTLLVAPGDRCRGVARALLTAAESAARNAGRTLLTMDAAADEHSDALYRRLDWNCAGTIPGHRLGAAGDTRIYFKPIKDAEALHQPAAAL